MASAETIANNFERTTGAVLRVATLIAPLWVERDLAFLPKGISGLPHQQPDGGDTPGVAVAPVAFAGAIIPGIARFIVILSAHADVFGVGTVVMVGSILVLPSSVMSG